MEINLATFHKIIGISSELAISFSVMNLLERNSKEKTKLFKGEWLNNAGTSKGNNMQLLKRINVSYSNLSLRNFKEIFSSKQRYKKVCNTHFF